MIEELLGFSDDLAYVIAVVPMAASKQLKLEQRANAMSDETQHGDETTNNQRKTLSPAAQRALAEAEARRAARADEPRLPREINGRGGLEPVRYGDWEVDGLTSDF